jgi:hypothetical protein
MILSVLCTTTPKYTPNTLQLTPSPSNPELSTISIPQTSAPTPQPRPPSPSTQTPAPHKPLAPINSKYPYPTSFHASSPTVLAGTRLRRPRIYPFSGASRTRCIRLLHPCGLGLGNRQCGRRWWGGLWFRALSGTLRGRRGIGGVLVGLLVGGWC